MKKSIHPDELPLLPPDYNSLTQWLRNDKRIPSPDDDLMEVYRRVVPFLEELGFTEFVQWEGSVLTHLLMQEDFKEKVQRVYFKPVYPQGAMVWHLEKALGACAMVRWCMSEKNTPAALEAALHVGRYITASGIERRFRPLIDIGHKTQVNNNSYQKRRKVRKAARNEQMLMAYKDMLASNPGINKGDIQEEVANRFGLKARRLRDILRESR